MIQSILKNADIISNILNREYIISEYGIIYKMRTENFLVPNKWLITNNWTDEIIYTLEKLK